MPDPPASKRDEDLRDAYWEDLWANPVVVAVSQHLRMGLTAAARGGWVLAAPMATVMGCVRAREHWQLVIPLMPVPIIAAFAVSNFYFFHGSLSNTCADADTCTDADGCCC
jgi:hypothetical protein